MQRFRTPIDLNLLMQAKYAMTAFNPINKYENRSVEVHVFHNAQNLVSSSCGFC